MSFNPAFLVSSYLIVLLGLAGLILTGELSSVYVLAAAASFAMAVLIELRGGKGYLPRPLANLLIVGVFFLTLFSIFVLRTLPIQELVHFLLALQSVKLLGPKKNRDWLQLYLLSFFSIVSVSALSVEITVAIILILYLFTAPWVLILFHLKGTMEETGKDPARETRMVSWSLLGLVGRTSTFLLLFTLILFVSFPRFRAGLFGDSWASGTGVTGFTDRLSLGDVSEIKKNHAVAMRVSVDRPDLLRKTGLYWRGLSLDRFDGKKWERSTSALFRIRRRGQNYLVGERTDRQGPLIRQEIILEPTGSRALFSLGRPIRISGKFGNLFRDPLGNVRSAYPFPFQISYTVLSQLEANRSSKRNGISFLQLPPVDPRIAALSRNITEGVSGDEAKARALQTHLLRNYRYSLKNLPKGDGDPLARFLFEARQGDCEYFSSALTVMLRSLGIPARVVNGYLGGEWNRYGEYYLIRQSNAHSWVEAYLQDKGWVTMDPTPPVVLGPGPGFFATVTQFADFLRLRWYRYVVNFGFGDQFQILTAFRRSSTWINRGMRGFSIAQLRRRLSITPDRRWTALGVLLAALVLCWIWFNKGKRAKATRSATLCNEATKRYRRFLQLLGEKGFRKKPGETPEEFSRTVDGGRTGLAGRFTALYQQARFSGRTDPADLLDRMDAILPELVKWKASSPP